MKKGLTGLIFFLISLTAVAQLHPVDKGSNVKFAVKNFGFSVTGTMAGLEGDIVFDPAHADAARFDVTVNATTINTGNDSRDEHLRDDDYFDVKNHPRIRFVSRSVRGSGSNFSMEGDLTIKNKTKALTIPFKADPAGKGFIFEGTFKINRRDFGVGGGSTVSDNVSVTLRVTAE